MADKINGLGRPPLDIAQSRNRAVGKADEVGQGAAAAKPGSGADAVSVSAAASRLQRIEAALAALPEIDGARVEALRQQVESGTYRVDAERLADRLIEFERGLR